MQRYVPKVHFYDPKTQLLVMDYVPPTKKSTFMTVDDQISEAKNILISRLIKRLTGIGMDDMNDGNINVTNLEIKFVDLGL